MRLLVSALVLFLPCTFTVAQTVSEIREAWKNLAVPRIQYKYRVSETLARDGKTYEGKQSVTFVFDSPKYMATIEGQPADPFKTTESRRLVYNGVDYRDYFRSRGRDTISGTLVRDASIFLGLDELLPVLAAHSPELGLRRTGAVLEDFTLSDKSELVGGVNCVCFVREGLPAYPTAEVRLLLEPSRHFALVAIQQSNGGKRTEERYFNYHTKGDTNVLDSYRHSTFDDDGVIASHADFRVQDVALPASIDESTFILEYPEGTFVSDVRGMGDTTDYQVLDHQLTELNPDKSASVSSVTRFSSYVFFSVSTVVVLAAVIVSAIRLRARR